MINFAVTALASEESTGSLPSVPEALRILERLEHEVEHAETFVQITAIAAAAAGWQRAFKPVNEVSNRAGLVWTKADHRLGVELAKVPKATGTAGQGRPKIGVPKSGPPISDTPTLAEMGVEKNRAARAQQIAKVPLVKIDAVATDLASKGKAVTPTAVLSAIRQETKRDKIHAVSVAAFSSDGPFGTVVIDPPWHMEKIDRDVRPNQDAFDYPTMTETDLAAFWTSEVAPKLEADCHCFMWTTQKHLPASLRLIEGFGFKYVLVMVWHKPGGFQPVGLPQYNCEFIVYARRGSPVFVDTKAFDCCFEAPRREHSRKPDAFYDTIRRVTGGSRIDVFSREARDGFAQFGNETDKFVRAA